MSLKVNSLSPAIESTSASSRRSLHANQDFTRHIPFHQNISTDEDTMIIHLPRTEIPRNAICLRGKAQKNAELYCEPSKRRTRRGIYKQENKDLTKQTTIAIKKKTFLINTAKIGTCIAVGAGVGTLGLLSGPVSPIVAPITIVSGAAIGAGVGLYWAKKGVVTKVNVTIERSDHFNQWRMRAIEDKVYPIFENFLNTEGKFKEFFCPLTDALISMPMEAPDGHTYEWEAIEDYINNITSHSDKKVPSPIKQGVVFSKNQLIFNRKYCNDLIKKAENTYNKVIQIQNAHIKAQGLKAVIKNTEDVMEFIRRQVEAATYTELQPMVDSGDITDTERDALVEKACTQWDFRKK